MGKRKSKGRDEDYIQKKIKKWQRRLQGDQTGESAAEETLQRELTESSLIENQEIVMDELPEEYLIALGNEGEEIKEVGDAIREELVKRWSKLMTTGLGKDARENITKKYPTPFNFPHAVAPVMNPEILASVSNVTMKRDKRITYRQNITGKIMTCLGKSLTSLFKGNINTKTLIEEINDAAKMAAEVFFQDSSSRKFFALAGATQTVKEAVRNAPTDEFLFGKDCAEKIKVAQTIQKTGAQIKTDISTTLKTQKPSTSGLKKQGNWKSPLPSQFQQNHQVRSGPRHQPVRKNYNYNQHRNQKQQPTRARNNYRR